MFLNLCSCYIYKCAIVCVLVESITYVLLIELFPLSRKQNEANETVVHRNSFISPGFPIFLTQLIAMPRSRIAGIGMYVPPTVFTNEDLKKYMDTSDEWIQERTGIKERRYADRLNETTTTMGVEASKIAIERAGITPQDIDFIVFATLSPDYYFPGCGVLLQRALKMKQIGALDVRNQCSGFVYALSVADQFIKTGMYKNILVVGSEKHSFGLDFTTRGRNVSVIFGDGAGAVVLQPTDTGG